VESWLIDTPLFNSLAPGGLETDSFRRWIETHEDPVFLSAVSIRKIRAAIKKMPASQVERAVVLTKWLDGLVTNFSDRIHLTDSEVYAHSAEIIHNRQPTGVRVRYHDVMLVATARIYGHGLLTKRFPVFGSWANVKLASP
jgi:predicted nucleic acid-binding protein